MKVLYSWAQATPGDWLEIDARQFRTLPDRGIPGPSARGNADNAPGHLSNLMVQGVMFNGLDHVAVAPYLDTGEDGVRVWAWNDDPDDYPVGQRVARVWTFLPLAPDPTFGSGDRERLLDSIRNEPGITEARRAEVLAWHNDPAHFPLNTRQSQVVYAEGDRYDRLLQGLPQHTTLRRWEEFVPPDPAITRHGIWVPDEHWERQENARTPTGWMHWNEHLPESECEWESGEIRHNKRMRELRAPRRVLREQRAQGRYSLAAHTITYYQRDTDRAVGYTAATHENAYELTTGSSATEQAVSGPDEIYAWSFTSPSGEPNSNDWPNGTYHGQLNCAAVSAGTQYGFNATVFVEARLGIRLDATATTRLSTFTQDESLFTTTGLHLGTKTIDVAAGDATDRFGSVVVVNGDGHADAVTLTLNTTDSYADGPWSAGGNVTVTPSTASLTTAQFAPVLALAVIPGVGSLAATGYAPVLAEAVIPATASLALTGFAPFIDVIPGTATLALTGYAPVLAEAVIPATASLTLTAPTPAVVLGTVVTPATTSLALTGFATVLAEAVIPGTASLVTATFAPFIDPIPGTLAVATTGYAPEIKVGVSVTPDAASLTLTGYAPFIDPIPATASLALTGLAPVLDTGVLPSAASATLTGYAPQLAETATPGTASLALTGLAPVLDTGVLPGTGALALTGLAPLLAETLTPGVAGLLLAGYQPVLGTAVIPPGLALVTAGYAPDIIIAAGGITVTPDTLALLLTGYAPALAITDIVPPAAQPASVAGGSGRVVLLPRRKVWREGWSVSVTLALSRAVGQAVRQGATTSRAATTQDAGASVVHQAAVTGEAVTWARARGHRRFPAAQLEAEDLRLLGIDNEL